MVPGNAIFRWVIKLHFVQTNFKNAVKILKNKNLNLNEEWMGVGKVRHGK